MPREKRHARGLYQVEVGVRANACFKNRQGPSYESCGRELEPLLEANSDRRGW